MREQATPSAAARYLPDDGRETTFEPIAIVGMAMRLPGGVQNGKDFWEMLVNKRHGLCTVPEDRYNVNGFYTKDPTPGALRQPLGYFLNNVDIKQLDTSFFSFPKKELERLDPQQRQLLEVAWECMENAGATNWRDTDIGCFVGVLGEDWRDLNSKETHQSGSYRVTGYEDAFLANRLSFEYNLHGPSLTVKTACSSSLYALHLACDSLRLGDCSSALVAGSSLIFSPSMSLAFSDQGIISPTGTCKTFDASADGYARGEALNMIYIKKLSDAIEAGDPIRAVIRATAANCDGRSAGASAGIMAPSPVAQEALIRRAYSVAGIKDFSETAYVECHGTGTQVGDPLEATAVANVFGEKGVLITSVKPNVGHSEGAAGLTSVIKAVLSLENKTVPPNIFFSEPNPQIPFEKASLRVPVDPEPWPTNRKPRVSVNSFGIGGSNSHVIIEGWEEDVIAPMRLAGSSLRGSSEQSHLLTFSAHSRDSLETSIDKYSTYLNENPVSLEDLSHTLATRREHLNYRSFAVTNSPSVFTATPGEQVGPVPHLVFIFTGQGAQWPQMGRGLIQTNSTFRETIRESERHLKSLMPSLGWSIEDELCKPASESKIHTAELSQPICTAIQIALVETLRAWKIEADVVLGHSSGEIAAAYTAGAISMKAAMAIACMRGATAQKSKRRGGMTAVGLGREEVLPFLEDGVVIACENSQRSTTLSGDLETVEKVAARIKTELPEVFVRMLKVERAYHSHHMQEFGESYEAQLTGVVVPTALRIPFYSSVTSSLITDHSVLGPAYWRKNLESPVLFNTALRALRPDFGDKNVFIEIGPHPALKGPMEQILRDIGHADDVHIGTLSRGADDAQGLLSLVGRLFVNNYTPDLMAVSPPGAVLTDLPSYSWMRDTKHWDESRITQDWRFRNEPPHELLGTRIPELNSEPHWRNRISVDSLSWLEGHQVAGQIVFPAAGYIAMVGEAIRQLSGKSIYNLKHVRISSALILEHGSPAEVITTLSPLLNSSPDDSVWYTFHISSFNGTSWVRHCSGEARPGYDQLAYPRDTEQAVSLPRKVNPQSWYNMMDEAGFCYGGLFRGLNTISSSTTTREAVGTAYSTGISSDIPYTLHPAMIDQCFQMLCIAAIQGQTRRYLRLAVPTFIEEIVIFSGGNQLGVKATGSASPRGSFRGDVMAQHDGVISMFMRGLNSSPLDSATQLEEDLRIYQQIEWKPDSDLSQLSQFFHAEERGKEGFLLVESLFLLCAADHVERIQIGEQTPRHLRKFHAWMRSQIDLVKTGKKNLVEKSHVLCERAERMSRIRSFAAQAEATEWAPCAVAITRLLDSAQAIFAGEIEALDVLMEGGLLSRLYDILDSGDYAGAITAIGHKNPRLRILEIGAGTGGTSLKILEALKTRFGERSYSHYTYTDVSPGFMNAAKERFQHYDNIEYRVLDVSKDPVDQGFDLNSYDLIVGANVVHATPSLHQSITHLRSLLRPGGQLFLQELSPEAKWINYIWGYLSGWWLGHDDGRPEEPYVLPERWTNEFVAAGFEAPHTVVYDYDFPHHINASIIGKVAEETKPTSAMTILCISQDEPNVQAMKARLEADGVEVAVCLFGQDTTIDQDVICFLDQSSPMLHGMDQNTFKQLFNHILSTKSKIFWVTRSAQIGCEDPRYGMILGLARSARQEQNTKLFTIELDAKTPRATAMDRICEIVRASNKEAPEDMELDWEYSVVDGVVHVPRMHWQTLAESVAQSADETALTTRRLTVATPGLLHTMHWKEETVPDLRDDEVRVRIKSVGMNFKDVLIAIAVLPNDISEIGIDVAAVVEARGSAVTNVDVGDRVIFVSPGSFTTSKVVPASHCVKLDASMSFEQGAAIPCVYITAMMALVDKGNLKKDQTVLIHSACGGVGLAAIQIAKSIGAEVFCTVGNQEKVKYLIDNYGIPESHIFNSRNDSFAADVMRATNERGVDLVLNSLSGELLHASWKCVAEFGLMVEIGKRDFQRHARLSMDVFELNRGFIGLDLGHVFQYRPAEAVSALERCMELIRSGVTKPLPLANVFEAADAQEAFRVMQGGQHIGKMIVNMPDDPRTLVSVKATPKPELRSDRSYLVVGGLGGLGKVVVAWMVENGARNLILLSRSGDSDQETREFLLELQSQGCQTQVYAGSVSRKADVEAAVRGAVAPIAGVINMSMVLKDISAPDMTFDDWKTVTQPKVQGTQNLHEAVTSKLDFFILFGSCSGIAGQWGQVNYGAANTYLDAFVQYRHANGLPASVIDLGAVGDAGYVSQNQEVLAYMQSSSTYLLREREVLDAVALAIQRSLPSKRDSTASGYVDKSQIILGLLTTKPITDERTRVPWKRDPRMSFYHNLHSATDTSSDASLQKDEVKAVLAQAASSPEILSTESTQELIASALGSALFSFLLKSPEDMHLDRSLESIGVDSLVAMELRNWIRQKFAVEVTTLSIIHSASLLSLAELISQALLAKYQVTDQD